MTNTKDRQSALADEWIQRWQTVGYSGPFELEHYVLRAIQAEREATLADVEDALAHAWGDDGLPDWIETELSALKQEPTTDDIVSRYEGDE